MTAEQAGQILATVTAMYLREFSAAEAQVWARCLAPLDYELVAERARQMVSVHDYPRLKYLLGDGGTGGKPRQLGGSPDPEHDRWQLRRLSLAPAEREREDQRARISLDHLTTNAIDWPAHVLRVHEHLDAIDRRWPNVQWAALEDRDIERNLLVFERLINSLEAENRCPMCPDPAICRGGKAVVKNVEARKNAAGELRLWYRSGNCRRRAEHLAARRSMVKR